METFFSELCEVTLANGNHRRELCRPYVVRSDSLLLEFPRVGNGKCFGVYAYVDRRLAKNKPFLKESLTNHLEV